MDHCWSAQLYPAKKYWKWGLETYIVSCCHDDIQVDDWQLHLDQSGLRWASLTSCDRWWDQELLVSVNSSRDSNKTALQLQEVWETHACICSVAQLCPTLCNPMDYSLPGSSVHGILQEYWSVLSSKGSYQPRVWTHISFFKPPASFIFPRTCIQLTLAGQYSILFKPHIISYVSYIGRQVLYH